MWGRWIHEDGGQPSGHAELLYRQDHKKKATASAFDVIDTFPNYEDPVQGGKMQ
jgi:hypothetical protein